MNEGESVFDLLSQRIRNSNGEPEVYIYDELPEGFRNQVYYIMQDIVDLYNEYNYSHYITNLWNELHNMFAREKGLKRLGTYYKEMSKQYGKHNIGEYLDRASTIDILDLIDYVFNYFDKKVRNEKMIYDDTYTFQLDTNVDAAIKELNFRFKQHNLGYEFINGEIIRIDNTITHSNIIKPALKLIYDEDFSGAEEEIKRAFEYRRESDNKNAILEAGKAFESTMKTICDKKGYKYDKTKDNAQKLIHILEANNFYPTYMTSHLTNLRTTLETGLPVVRNKNAGHGQGNSILNVSDEFAEYALNLAATNIVLLIKVYRNTK